MTVTPDTRVVGQRASFAEIPANDVIPAEGPQIGTRLRAERIDVVLASDSLKVPCQPTPPIIELVRLSL